MIKSKTFLFLHLEAWRWCCYGLSVVALAVAIEWRTLLAQFLATPMCKWVSPTC